MKYKGLEYTDIDQMINEHNDRRLQAAWKNSLGHQIAINELPGYLKIKEDLINIINKIS